MAPPPPAPARPRQPAGWRARVRAWWEKTFPAEPAPPPAPPAGGGGGGGDKDWADRLEKILAGVTSGVGTAALVAFTGGAIQWTRFSHAGLPADQAVAAIPRQELVVIGAASLVGYLVLASLIVLAVYVINREGRPTIGLAVCLVALAFGAAGYAWMDDKTSKGAPLIILVIGLLLGALVLGVSARTDSRFRWVGTTLFLAIALIGAATAYAINERNPQVQPVAALRGPDDAGLTGLYVGINDKRLVIGTTKEFRFFRPRAAGDAPGEPEPMPAAIVEVPCADVTIAAVGALRGRKDDPAAAAADLLDVIRDARGRGRPAPRADAAADAAKAAEAKALC